MQIIIPMAGSGDRFLRAGESVPKPLIKIDGTPMIEHVIRMFGGGRNDFLFICNEEHLALTDMECVLKNAAPEGKIIGIAPHKKGPVYTVLQAAAEVGDDETIVNYCDFSCHWNFEDFLRHTRIREADGAIAAYRGFHPHMLGGANYAFIRQDRQWLHEIKEKEPFTGDKMSEFASSGTYYFKKGAYIKEYFNRLILENINTGGEYYVSMIYNLMNADGLKTSIYEIQHMLQWGTPEDMAEYSQWSEYFKNAGTLKNAANKTTGRHVNVIPIAGTGARFAAAGYDTPKPLIEIGGKPMAVRAAECLPAAKRNIFICQARHIDEFRIDEKIKKFFKDAEIITLDGPTGGQACTCEAALGILDPDTPVMIGACDNAMAWDAAKFSEIINHDQADAVIWSFKNNYCVTRNPYLYGWLEVSAAGDVRRVSVKKPISGRPYDDHAIIGAFYFRKAEYFKKALKSLYDKNLKINGEFYVDSCAGELVEMGLKVKAFQVDRYLCWGTPEDLKTYEYWQSFFHKCKWHDYSLETDPLVDTAAVRELDEKYRTFYQKY